MGFTSDEDDDLCTSPKQAKRQKQRHREQKYRPAWEKNTDALGFDVAAWLGPDKSDPHKAACKWCATTMQANITVLKDHKNSKKHLAKKDARGAKGASLITKYTVAGSSQPIALSNSIKNAEIKLSGCFAAHNVPFQFVDHLLPTLKSCFPDSPICKGMEMKRMKLTKIVSNVIGASYKDDLSETLKQAKFSILVDESTTFNLKTSALVVRLYDSSVKRIVCRLFDLSDVFPKGNFTIAKEGATGARLFDMIVECFSRKSIPIQNIIGFACDNASVMVGEQNSVYSRLKEICPDVILMRCICHSLHLAAKDASKCLPRSCEDLARNLHSFFEHSNKRVAQFQEFQEFLQVSAHRMLGLSLTRWLSLKENVERIDEQWDSLRLYITNEWVADHTKAAEHLHMYLNDPFMRLYFKFLKWVLAKVTAMNAYFQSTKVVVTFLHAKMAEAYKELLGSYLKPSVIMRTSLSLIQPDREENYCTLENMYLGVYVMEEMKKPGILSKPGEIAEFRRNCRNFLAKLCCGIKSRFDFCDPLLEAIPALTPENATSANRKFLPNSILPLCDLVPRAKPTDLRELQRLDDEWRLLPLETLPEEISLEKEVDVFWSKLADLKDGEDERKYRSLPKFALDVLSLPHSNADVERLFSKVTAVKTKLRNRILTKNIEGACLASECVKLSERCCATFQPTKDMLGRMTAEVLYKQDKETGQGRDNEEEDASIMEGIEDWM